MNLKKFKKSLVSFTLGSSLLFGTGGVIENTTKAYFKQIDFMYLDKTIYNKYGLSEQTAQVTADDCHQLLLNIEMWYLCTCANTTREQALKTLNHLYNVWNNIKTGLENDPPTREKQQRLKNENPTFKPDPNAKKMTTDQIIAEIDQQLKLWDILKVILQDEKKNEEKIEAPKYDELAGNLRNLLDGTHTPEFYTDSIKKLFNSIPPTKEKEEFKADHWADNPDYKFAIDTAITIMWSEVLDRNYRTLRGVALINQAFGLCGLTTAWTKARTFFESRNSNFKNYMCQY